MIAFPPRDETLAMYTALETAYRGQGYPARETFVDAEGTAVWIQQYLLYRVNGEAHQPAVAHVLADIDAIWHPQPIPPEPPIPQGRVYGEGRVFAAHEYTVQGELLIGPGDPL